MSQQIPPTAIPVNPEECIEPTPVPSYQKVAYVSVAPERVMSILSPQEVEQLANLNETPLYQMFRRCALAVLNTGSQIDDAKKIMEIYHDFNIQIVSQSRGIKLALTQAPDTAFVDGQLIRGIKEHLFSVLRDVVYINKVIQDPGLGVTNAIFHILRHAQVLHTGLKDQLVVCWGGHSISRVEYEYTKKVGYELGLRGLNIGTGCGPGAMKGPMKGATIGHAKQHTAGRYIGLTEPDIIAAEPPNPIVNELVILPDIEKRLEAFVRLAHGIIVFPGGVGTLEEILYLLGILLHPENEHIPFPLIFSAPECSRYYFEKIDHFLVSCLGASVRNRYKIVIANAQETARLAKKGIEEVFEFRKQGKDAFYFNWLLQIPPAFQKPFEPTHENMQALKIHKTNSQFEMAINLRKLFSGIVAGNVKESGIKRIEQHGPYRLNGEKEITEHLDALLRSFAEQGRMKLGHETYQPCYTLLT
jgi:pyrimidine/purine-5'-nucleotide nucleosidase